MNPVTFGNTVHPVHFGKRGDGENTGRLHRLAAAGALAVPLTLLGASAAFADPTPPPGGGARFVVDSQGQGFSANVPKTEGVKTLEEGAYACDVQTLEDLGTSTVECDKGDEVRMEGIKTGAIIGFVGAVLLALGFKSAGNKAKGFGK